MKKITYTLLLFLYSCAGTTTHLKMLEDGGAIRMEKSTENYYDYKIFIKNTVDIGWSGDNQEDRKKYINLLLKDECKQIQILSEESIQTGTYPINRPALTWISKVKCSK